MGHTIQLSGLLIVRIWGRINVGSLPSKRPWPSKRLWPSKQLCVSVLPSKCGKYDMWGLCYPNMGFYIRHSGGVTIQIVSRLQMFPWELNVSLKPWDSTPPFAGDEVADLSHPLCRFNHIRSTGPALKAGSLDPPFPKTWCRLWFRQRCFWNLGRCENWATPNPVVYHHFFPLQFWGGYHPFVDIVISSKRTIANCSISLNHMMIFRREAPLDFVFWFLLLLKSWSMTSFLWARLMLTHQSSWSFLATSQFLNRFGIFLKQHGDFPRIS